MSSNAEESMPGVMADIWVGERSSLGVSYGQEEKRRGAISTRTSVVDFILDIIGYTSDKNLFEYKLLEPSFGGGRFVLGAVDRLLVSWKRSRHTDISELCDAIRAVELDGDTFERFSHTLITYLEVNGFQYSEAQLLAEAWLVRGDYLLSDIGTSFDYIVGNPPYIRQELIEPNLLMQYRSLFPTMVGRADIYIAFIERSLDLLTEYGRLSFICADAWTKNDYGKAIRQKITDGFNLMYYIDMYGLDAFDVAVGAYPSITLIERGAQGKTRVARAASVEPGYLKNLAHELAPSSGKSVQVQEKDAVHGVAPWLMGMGVQSEVIRYLESLFPTLQDAGCRVGIGVATGADKVFIAPFDRIDVEDDRKLPLATNKCTYGGTVSWSGKGIINPWADEGGLVDLGAYPKLSAFLEKHREHLSGRHTAKSDISRKWYKTIDRITPRLAKEPKLLIPDIKGNGDAITFDPGTLYPHHNLYFITSGEWNLRALQALLRSGIAHLFVEAYSVKIGGGYLRFQAQNLKRIRVPRWDSIHPSDQAHMIGAGQSGSKLANDLLERIYQLQPGTLSFL